MKNIPRSLSLAIARLGWVVLGAVPQAQAEPVFKIYVEHSGVYEVTFDRLSEAGLTGSISSADLGLTNFGIPVPLWIEDGGDGLFEPGDRVVFVGELLRGENSYLDPFSRFNCYILSFSEPDPWIGETREAVAERGGHPPVLLARHHLETDRVMVRFRSKREEPEESWYWHRMSMTDKEPFHHELVLDGFARDRHRVNDTGISAKALAEIFRGSSGEAGVSENAVRGQIDSLFTTSTAAIQTVRLRVGLRGWSEPRHLERVALPAHEIEMHLNGTVVSSATWDGKDHFIHETEIPAGRFHEGANEFALVVPKRRYPESKDLLVDVVLLNWIEVEYEHVAVVGTEQLRLFPADDLDVHHVEFTGTADAPIELFETSGVRYRGRDGGLIAAVGSGTDGWTVLGPSAAAAPNDVVLDRPSNLKAVDRQADYLMIAHRTLMADAERLADFHRRRGLKVALVDVQDVYDDFNHGVLNPTAIKDFLEHAHESWRKPAPRFVLLVGDASWDFKNTDIDDSNYADWTYRSGEARKFVKNSSTPYAEGAELNHRNLVPTSSYPTTEGHAASDTWFVCLDDGDLLPDMAIGRLPVVGSEELAGIVDKTIGFASQPPVGPWKRNLLFIANESASFQHRSDLVAEEFARRGYAPSKIYPHPSEPANELHTRSIVEGFDEGLQVVHFIGHGGRYIWRTGAPDLEKNHDLFTLEHLDTLAENRRLPVVLSLTCYSAPFDHPTADSIGEKLIRIPGRGAIAVFAASWRNSPSHLMGQALLRELTIPGNTIGEAVMRAKHEFRSDLLVQTYNLLGDPAVEVGAPAHVLELDLEEGDGVPSLRVQMPISVASGRMLVDWVAEDGTTIGEDLVPVSGSVFRLPISSEVLIEGDRLIGARAYVWDEEEHIDGIGWTDLSLEDKIDDQRASGPDSSAGDGDTGVGTEPIVKGRS